MALHAKVLTVVLRAGTREYAVDVHTHVKQGILKRTHGFQGMWPHILQLSKANSNLGRPVCLSISRIGYVLQVRPGQLCFRITAILASQHARATVLRI